MLENSGVHRGVNKSQKTPCKGRPLKKRQCSRFKTLSAERRRSTGCPTWFMYIIFICNCYFSDCWFFPVKHNENVFPVSVLRIPLQLFLPRCERVFSFHDESLFNFPDNPRPSVKLFFSTHPSHFPTLFLGPLPNKKAFLFCTSLLSFFLRTPAQRDFFLCSSRP